MFLAIERSPYSFSGDMFMKYETLKVDFHPRIAHVMLHRPGAMNALDQQLLDELEACFCELNESGRVRAIVLSGTGKAFCVGGDVSFLQVINSKSPFESRQLLASLFQKSAVLARVKPPVIGALHGFVLGAGFSLALLCDLRLAAENTVFGAEFPKMGIIPELGCTHTLAATVGLSKAMEIALTGKRFDAHEASTIGLVNGVSKDEELVSDALALAGTIAELPPLAVGMTKLAIRKGSTGTLEESLEFESYANAVCYQTADHKEAAAAFLEKRKPVFQGR